MKRQCRRINVVAWLIVGADFLTMLAALMLVLPPQSREWTVLAPHVASALLMAAFGPYLLAGVNDVLGAMLLVVHLGLIGLLIRRVRMFDALGRWARTARTLVFAGLGILALLSFRAGFRVTEHHGFASEKVTGGPIRLTVISDLHSCAHGGGRGDLVRDVAAAAPDVVLFTGDIFDDRLTDGNAQDFIKAIAGRYPCFYVSGNHEFWSGRIDEMKLWLRDAGVTVLEGACRTLIVKGTAIDICGVDDPTYMDDAQWLRQLQCAEAQSDPAHVRVLLSHRPERVADYGKFGFDLVVAGHAHGGQWLIPLIGRGGYSPNQGFFPKYVDGRYALANGGVMFVSRGLARESTPLPRLFNPPEILVVELTNGGGLQDKLQLESIR